MVSLPVGRLVTDKDAIPFGLVPFGPIGATPKVNDPSVNVIVPVGINVPEPCVIIADRMTGVPYAVLFGEAIAAVVLGLFRVTSTVTAAEVDPGKLVSPA